MQFLVVIVPLAAQHITRHMAATETVTPVEADAQFTDSEEMEG